MRWPIRPKLCPKAQRRSRNPRVLVGGMNVDDLILVSIDDHVVEPPDMFLNHVPAKYKAEAPIVVHRRQGRRPVDLPGQTAGRQRAQRGGVVAAGGVGPRPGRLRRDATGCVRRARAGPGHEPQRHPRVDVLPDLHRLLGPAPQQHREDRSPWSWCRPTTTGTSTSGRAATRTGSSRSPCCRRGTPRRCAPRSAGSRPRAAAR